MIVGKKLKGFDNKLLYDKLNYPQCSCGLCPQFFLISFMWAQEVRERHIQSFK